MTTQGDITARAIAIPLSTDRYALEFELTNQGRTAESLSYLEPFMAFDVVARGASDEVQANRPTLDLAVQDVEVELAAGATATLRSPIQLRIREDAAPGSNGFVWTLPVRLDAVSIEVRLTMPAPFDIACPLEFAIDGGTAEPG